jgi:hypothetical protein
LASPKRSSQSVRNWRMSAARRSGSGSETKSAKAVRNPSASVNGKDIRASGTWAERRIATGSPKRTFPSVKRTFPRFLASQTKAGSRGFVQPAKVIALKCCKTITSSQRRFTVKAVRGGSFRIRCPRDKGKPRRGEALAGVPRPYLSKGNEGAAEASWWARVPLGADL